MDLARLLTEQDRPELADLDRRDTAALVRLMADDQAAALDALVRAAPLIAAAIDAVVERLEGGGRLVYVGAGTAGRMGVLDAAECPPTFNTDRVLGVLAGGFDALLQSSEAVEDDAAQGAADMDRLELSAGDAVVGVSASGRTPYTIGAVQQARRLGAVTVGVASNPDAELSRHVDHPLELVAGPEVIAGSTRLKAGTAQKVVLNMFSTIAMVRLGKTYGNLMVDLRATNHKLRQRARRIVSQATGADAATAERAIAAAGGDVKVAIVMLLTGADAGDAAVRLDAHRRHGARGGGGLMRVVGMISGTSMDGIDVAAAELDLRGEVVELRPLGARSIPYRPELRTALAAVLPPATTTAAEVCRLDNVVGVAFAEAAAAGIEELAVGDADLVVSHGQTIYHWVDVDGRAQGTLQIGQPAWIAEATGVPVVADLRARDVAAGGHGAPLASLFDHLLLAGSEDTTAALNLGGIANLTIVDPSADTLAFDTGPANALIDATVEHVSGGAERYDRDGARARRGRVDRDLLDQLLGEPYYRRPPPKSTGKELFNLPYLIERVAGPRDRGR